MTTYFITRHQGALEWAQRQGIEATVLAHLDVAHIHPGDTVIGTLPVHIAAEICAIGATYLHLILDTPEHMRGHELTADEMTKYNAHLMEFKICKQ